MLGNERIRLRAVEPEDLDLMYVVENDTALWAYGTTTVPYSRYSLRQFIAETRNDIFQDGQLRLVVESVSDGEALGFIDLQNLDARHRRAEVGVVLLSGWQGRGFATEALRMLCQYAARHLALRQLVAVVAKRNEPARRLFLRCAFTRVATLPHWLACPGGYEDAELMVWE
ncbi:MAG: GNAT family N-acetyltransferase [Bacteroidaceae bacterium]|nr:GNAT family N-acetyltransferase [Bacteroidaceae bacterium]